MRRSSISALVAAAACLAVPAGAQAASESLVNVDSPPSPFPQNKQNEPGLAIDAKHPSVVAAGSNDLIDLAPCDGSDCPFTPGVGVSGIYFSFDGGSSWTQPTYDGYSARDGTPGEGPIGTLPNYYEHGLVADGDPVLAFGPQPDGQGGFSYRGGSRLYYANLAANFASVRREQTFKGYEAIAVSHTDDPQAAAANDAGAWSNPAIVTERRQSSTTFSDKEAIWADNAKSSDFFGNAYVCYTQFRSNGGGAEPIALSRSTDGGEHWSKPRQLSAAGSNATNLGRQGCAVRTDSDGVVYVVWEDFVKHHSVHVMARSFDGGRSFERPRVVARVTDVGAFDDVRSISFDGIAGARTSSFPGFDIANGAPSGTDAPDTLALGWSDGADGLNDEHSLVQLSDNQGQDWSNPEEVEAAADRPDFTFVGLSPDGTDLYTVYDGFLDPFRHNTTESREFQGVLRHSDVAGTTLSGTTTVHRGEIGDARASSANALIDEFLGDYNTVAATNESAVAVWNDAREATVCPAINTYRQAIANGEDATAPAPATACPPFFGNTDIWSTALGDPTP